MTVPPPLTQLGRYTIVRTLGQGAMGVVYEGRDPRLDRQVAIKTILKGHLLDATLAADYSARFVREAQAVARLAHPNIVTVFDFGEQDEVAYLVMEFIRGRELAAHFEAGDFLDLPRAVRVMIELLDALAYAHERGIVHRDIKPANVMIDGGGHVKLTDFGVARLVDSNAERTMAGTMVGTPSYMSPEQVQGLAVGSRADLFAAGVILYQFLTHRRPFTGSGSFSIQKMIVHDHPVAPSRVNPALPAVFDTIVERALAKDPADRYPSATAFADDLRRTLAQPPDESGSAPHHSTPPAGAAGAPQHSAALPGDPDATVVRATSPPLGIRPHGGAAITGTAATPSVPAAESPTAPPDVPRASVPATAAAPAAAPASRRLVVAAAVGGVAIVGALVFALSRPAPDAAAASAASGRAAAPGAATTAGPAAAPAPAITPATAPGPAPAPAPAPGPAPAPAEAAAALPAATTGQAQASPAVQAGSAPPAVAPSTAPAVAAAASSAVRGPTVDPGSAPAPHVARGEPRKPQPSVGAPADRTGTGAAARAAATRASISRCSDLLQRVQLGDTLSASDLEVFQKECKR